MKRIAAILLTALMIMGLTACNGKDNTEPEEQLPKVVFVAEGGLDGSSVNEKAYDGILKAQEDLAITGELVETQTGQASLDAVANAAQNGARLVISTAFLSNKKMKKIAEQYPQTFFALIDYDEEIAPNVMSLSYQEQEGAFLAGVIAALHTNTKIIGFIGGEEGELTDGYEYGFRSGVKSIDPNIQVIKAFTGTYLDPAAGKKAAFELMGQGADILYEEIGKAGLGVLEAATMKGIRVIGPNCLPSEEEMEENEENQDNAENEDNAESEVTAENIEILKETLLCSTYERYDSGAYLAVQMMMEGDFAGGALKLGVDFEAVGYSDKEDHLSKELKAQVRSYIKAIAAGEIYVPQNEEEFQGFVVPAGGFFPQTEED